MRAEGYGADIAFDGTQIVVTGKGLGKGVHRIPVDDLSSLEFKDATRLVNGHIQLVTVNGTSRVRFRRKQAEAMRAVYEGIVAAVPGLAHGGVRPPAAPEPEATEESQGQTAFPPGTPPPANSPYGQPPSGRPVEAWSAVVTRQNVVGESHHTSSFKALLREYGHKGSATTASS